MSDNKRSEGVDVLLRLRLIKEYADLLAKDKSYMNMMKDPETQKKLRLRKRAEAVARLSEEKDALIGSAYRGAGGIEFYVGIFIKNAQRYTSSDLLDACSVDEMHTALYNSALLPVLNAVEQLKGRLAQTDERIRTAKTVKIKSSSVMIAIGMTDARHELKDLWDMLNRLDSSREETMRQYEKVRGMIKQNSVAVHEAILKAEFKPEPYVLMNAELLGELLFITREENIKSLRDIDGADPDSYARAAAEYAQLLKTHLTDRYQQK